MKGIKGEAVSLRLEDNNKAYIITLLMRRRAHINWKKLKVLSKHTH